MTRVALITVFILLCMAFAITVGRISRYLDRKRLPPHPEQLEDW